MRAAQLIERYFAMLIVAAAAAGMFFPALFLWARPFIPAFMGVVIFGIGLTIRSEHLKVLMQRPYVAFFALGKFLIMPCVAYAAGVAFQLPVDTLIGIIILGACPGGVSANVMSYLARANTAITVLLTIFTTLLSPLVTPWILYLFFHHSISLDIPMMMSKLFWIVLFPIADAIFLRRYLKGPAERIEWALPPLSMLMIALIIGFVASANRETLLDEPWLVLLAVAVFNLGGYAIGYGLARLFRFDAATCRAVGFEYGIQDSSLGIIIATGFFSTLAALPCAVCSVMQNLTGPWLARYFVRKAGHG